MKRERGKNRSEWFRMRMTAAERQQIRTAAKARGMSQSEFVRDAIRAAIQADQGGEGHHDG